MNPPIDKKRDEFESQLSIEEVGDSAACFTEVESEGDQAEKKAYHNLVMFTNIEMLTKLIQNYRVYLICACTEEQFAKVLHMLINLEKKHYNGVQVSFLDPSHDKDSYRMAINCENCARCKFAIIIVDESKCLCEFDSENFMSIDELLALECKTCGSLSPAMRLNSEDNFNSCLKFHLICKNRSLRTPTIANLSFTTLDSSGRVITKTEKPYPVCFHNMDEFPESSSFKEMPKKDKQKLEQNYENIMAMMVGEKEVVQYLITNNVLKDNFKAQMDILTRQEFIGKFIRHLFVSGDSLLYFIEALQATELSRNMELAEILCKEN